MDVKSKANFINSVTNGQQIPCPSCDSLNIPGTCSCINCGAYLATDNQNASTKSVFDFAETDMKLDDEPLSVFAEGLPSWDLVPPQFVVRRKRNK